MYLRKVKRKLNIRDLEASISIYIKISGPMTYFELVINITNENQDFYQ